MKGKVRIPVARGKGWEVFRHTSVFGNSRYVWEARYECGSERTQDAAVREARASASYETWHSQ